jgi:cell division protein FtsQ
LRVNSRGANRRVPDRATRRANLKALAGAVLRNSVLVFGTAAAAAATLWGGWQAERYLTTAPRFAIDELVVDCKGSLDHLDANQLRTIAGLGLGDNIFRARLDQARARLEQNPWIRTARVTRELPRRVRLAVEQRRAVAYVELSGLYLLDETGQVFKRATREDQLDLPTVTGLSRPDFIAGTPEIRSQIDLALGLIVAHPGTALPWDPGELSEVHFDPDLGVTLELGSQPTDVNLGFPPFGGRLERLGRTRGELSRRQLRAKALYLDDVRQPDNVGMALAGPVP